MMRRRCRGRVLGIAVAVAHGLFSGSLNVLLKFLLSRFHFTFLTLVQCLTSSTAALSLELLRRLGLVAVPPFGLRLARAFAGVAALSTLQSSLTLWALRGLSLPMYVVFKRCLPLVTMLVGVLVLKNGAPSPGVLAAVLITTCGAALAGERGDPPAPRDRARAGTRVGLCALPGGAEEDRAPFLGRPGPRPRFPPAPHSLLRPPLLPSFLPSSRSPRVGSLPPESWGWSPPVEAQPEGGGPRTSWGHAGLEWVGKAGIKAPWGSPARLLGETQGLARFGPCWGGRKGAGDEVCS